MDISFVTEYVSPIALVVCLGVGFIIKACTDNTVVRRLIPCIVGVLGVVICAWGEQAFTPQILAVGLMSGLASTGLYEAFRNVIGIAIEDRDANA